MLWVGLATVLSLLFWVPAALFGSFGAHRVPFCPVGASFCRNRPDVWPRQRPIRLRGTGYRHPSLSPPLPADDLGLALSQHTKTAGANSTWYFCRAEGIKRSPTATLPNGLDNAVALPDSSMRAPRSVPLPCETRRPSAALYQYIRMG